MKSRATRDFLQVGEHKVNTARNEKIKAIKNIFTNELPNTKQLRQAKKLLDEILSDTQAKRHTPIEELLGPEFKKFSKSYVSGISPTIKSVIDNPQKLQKKLDTIFSGLSGYLQSSGYPLETWHKLANSIATHARIIHRKSPEAPSLLYISLNKNYRSAKVVVLDSPTRGDLISALHPDTKAINDWLNRLNL